MRITVVTCDNCGQRINESDDDLAGNWARVDVLSQDWCKSCIQGFTINLMELPFHQWPKRVTKESLKEVLEDHTTQVNKLKQELREVHKSNKTAREELKDLRRQAADAYHDQRRPVEALQDIATAARRENGE